MLEASRSSRVVSFDLGDFKWARRADELVREMYGRRRFPGVVFGDSHRTLFATSEHEAGGQLRCDAAFVDGAKTYAGRLQHIRDLRAVSPSGARIFMDEVTSRACVDGTFSNAAEHDENCKKLNLGYYEATRAYTEAVRSGLMRVLECEWPSRTNQTDGVCMAEFT